MDKVPDSGRKGGVKKGEVSSSCEEFKICRPDSGLPSSSGSSNPFVSSSRSSSSSVTLRSSVLGTPLVTPSSTNSAPDSQGKTFVLNPPRLSNPFPKPSDEEKEAETGPGDKTVDTSPSTKEKSGGDNGASSSVADNINANSTTSKVSFVPLGWNSTSCSVSTSSSVSSSHASAPTFSSFVFGQNLRDKVEDPKSTENQTEVSSTTVSHEHVRNVEEPKANGTSSEMLFSSAVNKHDANDSKPSESTKSLSEAAREYEEARSVKRKFDPVQLITGEEHERNVLQMNCKLFAYDKASSSWQERGRGLLRLNDSPQNTSRLIIRAHGSLRLLINTKVWSEMVVQRASPKSLRITAMDNSETVKVFLISASQTEMDDLQRYLETRVSKSEKADVSNHSKKLKSNSDHMNNLS